MLFTFGEGVSKTIVRDLSVTKKCSRYIKQEIGNSVAFGRTYFWIWFSSIVRSQPQDRDGEMVILGAAEGKTTDENHHYILPPQRPDSFKQRCKQRACKGRELSLNGYTTGVGSFPDWPWKRTADGD